MSLTDAVAALVKRTETIAMQTGLVGTDYANGLSKGLGDAADELRALLAAHPAPGCAGGGASGHEPSWCQTHHKPWGHATGGWQVPDRETLTVHAFGSSGGYAEGIMKVAPGETVQFTVGTDGGDTTFGDLVAPGGASAPAPPQDTLSEDAGEGGRLSNKEMRELKAAFDRDAWATEWNSLPTAVERILAARQQDTGLAERLAARFHDPEDCGMCEAILEALLSPDPEPGQVES